MPARVLLLDRPPASLAELAAAFAAATEPGTRVARFGSIPPLLERLAADRLPGVVVVAAEGTGAHEPRRVIARLREASPDVPVVVAAREGGVEAAAAAVAAGATDFLVLSPPLGPRVVTLLGKLRPLLEALDRNRRLDELNAGLRTSIQARFHLVGESRQMRELLDRIPRVARVPRPVLVVGERGTGKELVARAIHFAAGPATRPIVTVNCAAFSDALLESELFGHERGAFTGADTQRRGKFELADGGTLFLDEIGNMSPSFQQKVLRVVEYGTYHRVGGSTELRTSARVIAATNVDLRERIRRGEFLGDLYDRLAFEVLEVPPLRERRGDIPVLARHFLDQFAREIPAFRGKRLSRAAIEALERYAFPGNVRELKNIIERAAYRDTDPEIDPADIDLLSDGVDLPSEGGFEARVTAFRRRLLAAALTESDGNRAEAARRLGLTYDQFRWQWRSAGLDAGAPKGKAKKPKCRG